MLDYALSAHPRLKVPVVDGGFTLVYEPDPAHPNTWMLNDHSLIQDKSGRIHLFAIENPYPTRTQALQSLPELTQPDDEPIAQTIHRWYAALYPIETHYRVGHAIADNIYGPWTRLPAALGDDKEKYHYGSPFVMEHQHRYWMFLPAGPLDDLTVTGIYVSDDLESWSSVAEATPWWDTDVFGASHRDPCIILLEDGTFLQYFSAGDRQNRAAVLLATSSNLISWHPHEPCYIEQIDDVPSHGIFESNFVYKKDDLYYLFVCFAHRHYYETFVVVSDDPHHFSEQNKITTLFTHAPELIEINGETYMTSCGIEDPQDFKRVGLWISKLKWLTPV